MARSIKKNWKINDPYEIATRLGISVIHTNSCVKDFTAHTIKMPGYPTTISINNKYSEKAKKILDDDFREFLSKSNNVEEIMNAINN